MADVAWSRYPVVSADPQGRSWLAYVAITRGMRRVTITHCAFRRGYATPSCFLDDIPDAANKVKAGWHPDLLQVRTPAGHRPDNAAID